jgi:hypothetical protein
MMIGAVGPSETLTNCQTTQQHISDDNILNFGGFTQPLTEMSNRNTKIMFLGSEVRRVRKADNLTAIYEPIV